MFSKRLAMVLLVAWPVPLVAQAPRVSKPGLTDDGMESLHHLRGQRVRVTELSDTSPLPVEGVLIRSLSDTLFLEVAGRSDPVVVVASRRTQIERWTRHDPTTRYLVTGVLLGAVVGGVAANWINNEPEPQRCTRNYDDPVSAIACGLGAAIASSANAAADQVAAIVVGGAVGAALGALGGIKLAESRTKEGWDLVVPSEFVVTPTAKGGVQLALRFDH